MPEPPRRRWIQLHLSTAIVLTLTAGWLVILNLQPQIPGAAGPEYGFPFSCACYANGYPYKGGPVEFFNFGYNNFFLRTAGGIYTLVLTELIWNIAIAGLILASLAFGLEYLARRKRVLHE